MGALLGSGAFNHVYEAQLRNAETVQRDDTKSQCFTYEGHKENEEARYVVKRLRPETTEDPDTFKIGAMDLALEAKLLSCMNHKNIVKLHGVTAGCPSKAFTSSLCGNSSSRYFLVLERLQCTLSERIADWYQEERRYRKGVLPFKSPGLCESKRKELLMGRLRAACDIAEGLAYLHTNNIAYRDLKPENIGFDRNGTAKIFDFGLAKELHPDDANRRPTALVGTFRYMAPEVAKCKNYGLSIDAYSFGLLLWEICFLRRPFCKFSRQQLMDKVIYGGNRPKTDPSLCPSSILGLMQLCWS